jgi:tetratricopeptide (TPR) repeat protein
MGEVIYMNIDIKKELKEAYEKKQIEAAEVKNQDLYGYVYNSSKVNLKQQLDKPGGEKIESNDEKENNKYMSYAFYNRALELIHGNNISCALRELEKCIKFYDKDSDILNVIGICCYLNCDFDEAYAYFEKSQKVSEKANRASIYLAEMNNLNFKAMVIDYEAALKRLKNWETEKALGELKNIIDQNPELSEPYIIAGLCAYEGKNYKLALKLFKTAFETDNGNKQVETYIEMTMDRLYKHNGIIKTLKKVKPMNYIFTILAILLCAVLFEIMTYVNSSQTVKDYKHYYNLKMDKRNSQNESLENTNKKLKADIGKLSLSNKILKIGDGQKTFQDGFMQFKNGNYKAAAATFDKILKYGKENDVKQETLYFYANCYEKLGDKDKALDEYLEYINNYKKTDYYDEALYNAGILLYRQGKLDGAKKILKALVREEPDSIYINSIVKNILKE